MTDLVIRQQNKLVIAYRDASAHVPLMHQRATDPIEMTPEAVGERLTMLREAFDLKKSEIADLLEIERTYWSRFEGGKRVIPLPIAYLLVERFGVTLDWIILGRWDTLTFELRERLRATHSE
jgi:DNA-binding XRE family transcriptional regulator